MKYLLIGFGQALTYLLATINIRAAAKGKILPTVLSDFVLAAIVFWIIRAVAEAQSVGEFLAYVIGGGFGSAAAILLTRKWDTHGSA